MKYCLYLSACFCLWNEQQREPCIMQYISLPQSQTQYFCPHGLFRTCHCSTVLGHMRNFSWCGGAMGHLNCDPGFILCSAVIQLSPILIKYILWCEFCSEGNSTFPFWKEVLHISVNIIIQKFYKGIKKNLWFTISQSVEVMCF